MTTRRTILAGGFAAMLPIPALAAEPASVERFPLWPGTPPGAPTGGVADQWVERSATGGADDIAWPHVGVPMLTVVRPARPNGAAVLICPGGGYARVAVGRTGGSIARDFASRGITAFEMLYRLPHDDWAAGPDVALQDAQRAMRLIRAGAGSRWTVDPTRVAATGFSAGGHVAARLASRAALSVYQPVDAADRLSARPDVAGLFFPVITMGDAGVHAQSRRELLGSHAADPAWQRRYSAELDLPADMPPTYVACNGDDPVVPMANSILMYQALHAAKVPASLVVYERGGHGPPAPHRDGSPVPWIDQFTAWAGDHGWPAALPPAASPKA
ncbi:alpha/beta hydrolase [Sphingomonas sp. MA1305]|uniref:alpha/beta hydrolase n=1 Tax=Sphingomonas sp. MA1305 TaxID=2479204 RepID=UPI0018E0569A|nr:alpha/beta hydrolase [Sphingomonas sp. MA1305]MBI0476274.1 alpha/beta hydrolase [Sphingomonas sp. MA1305]